MLGARYWAWCWGMRRVWEQAGEPPKEDTAGLGADARRAGGRGTGSGAHRGRWLHRRLLLGCRGCRTICGDPQDPGSEPRDAGGRRPTRPLGEDSGARRGDGLRELRGHRRETRLGPARRLQGDRELRRRPPGRRTRPRPPARGTRRGRQGRRVRSCQDRGGREDAVLAHPEGGAYGGLRPAVPRGPSPLGWRRAGDGAGGGLPRSHRRGRASDLTGDRGGAKGQAPGHERPYERGHHRRCWNRAVGRGRLGRRPVRLGQRPAGLRYRQDARRGEVAGAPRPERGPRKESRRRGRRARSRGGRWGDGDREARREAGGGRQGPRGLLGRGRGPGHGGERARGEGSGRRGLLRLPQRPGRTSRRGNQAGRGLDAAEDRAARVGGPVQEGPRRAVRRPLLAGIHAGGGGRGCRPRDRAPLLGGDFGEWFYRALAMLIIACPCALVISTPVTVVSGIGAASRRGILLKGGAALEAAGRLKALALDKTGTLTEGRPVLSRVVALGNPGGRDEALVLAAALERRSEHPLAHAILSAGAELAADGSGLPPVANFHSVAGRGAEGEVDGERYLIGSPRLFAERGMSLDGASEALEAIERAGETPVVLGRYGGPLAVFGLADALRPDAKATVGELRESGVGEMIML